MQTLTITTDNPNAALRQASQQWDIPLERIDFDILSYQTYYKGNIDAEWIMLLTSRLEDSLLEKEIRSSSFYLKQEYQLTFKPLEEHPHFKIKLSLATDRLKTKAVAIIDPSSQIPLKKGIQEYLKALLHKKKLRAGMMIGITDNDLEQEINKLLLAIQKEGSLSKPYRLPITSFITPIFSVDDTILLHYKKNKRNSNFIEGVDADDLIMEYIFPKAGVEGRSCTGEHIAIKEPLIRYASSIAIDPETITTQEDEHSIRYYATKSGFVQRISGIFSIANELRIQGASFKKTGSIEVGEEKDIHVKIHHKHRIDDAISSGIKVDVQKLDVKGSVGSHTQIQAIDVAIDSLTHKKSIIEAQENATIHLHRGTLKAKIATINILESGIVEAEEVHVSKMSGGEIIARRVTIDTLYSNAKVSAVESIEINTIVGNGNNLIINPNASQSYLDEITALTEQIKNTTAQIHQTRHVYNQVENRFSKLLALDKELTLMENELATLQEADLHAIITHHDNYNGHTRIHFIDPITSQTHAISPKGEVLHIRLKNDNGMKKFIFES